MYSTEPAFERKSEVIQENDYSVTFDDFIRVAGTEEWVYTGTVTHYANGDIELEDCEW